MVDTDYGIDLGDLARPLLRYGRGALTTDELCGLAIKCELPAAVRPDCVRDVVTTAAELHRRLVESPAFENWGDGPWPREQAAAQVLVALILNTRITLRGDLQLARYPGVDQEWLRAFRRHWADQFCDFIQTSHADLRVARIGMAAERGIDNLLPTALLLETLATTAELTPDEFPHRGIIATTLVHRYLDEGDDTRALAFASGFGGEAHRLLLEMAQGLHANSSYWPALMESLEAHRARILADRDCAAVLYAAANAAAGSHPAWARSLLGMAQLDTLLVPADTDNLDDVRVVRGRLQIELHAVAAVIRYAIGDFDDAVRCAQVCARLEAERAAELEGHEDELWSVPKAAAWILATAEPDPNARVVILKRGYDKYDCRGALEGRLALQVADAYVALEQPELTAYFLAQAMENAGVRMISDHFPCLAEWHKVSDLLEVARVSNDELSRTAAALRRLGYLPEPETGPRFWWIDEQWYRNLWSDDPGLVAPKPKPA